MNYPTRRHSISGDQALLAAVMQAIQIFTPPPTLTLTLIEWANEFHHVAPGTTASPGKWHTDAQPCAFAPYDHLNATATEYHRAFGHEETLAMQHRLVCPRP